MRFLKPIIAFAFFFSTITGPLQAEDIPESAKTPAEAMGKLSGMLGEWILTSEVMTEEGEWAPTATDRVSVTASLNNLLFTEHHKERMNGEGFVVETDFTFDQIRSVYRAAVVDDTWGLMDIYEGELEGETLVLTNMRAGTDFELQDGRRMNFRLTIPVAGDERIAMVDQSVDSGETWRAFYRLTYKRASSE